MANEFYSHGKLLLTSEYVILHGATALALPTKLGQHLKVKKTSRSDLYWKSVDPNGEVWFDSQISLYDFSAIKTSDPKKTEFLANVLENAVRLNSEFLDKWNGFKVETTLEFQPDWGMGSSSTMIANVAQWADISPFELFFKSQNGSGYDIACAVTDGPLYYSIDGDDIGYGKADFRPSFKKNLFFIYSGNKQNSTVEVESFLKSKKPSKKDIDAISDLSENMDEINDLKTFQKAVDEHEKILAKILKRESIKKERFSDFDGSLKSLGAWGGDFILAATELPLSEVKKYFNSKELDTVFEYDDLIL